MKQESNAKTLLYILLSLQYSNNLPAFLVVIATNVFVSYRSSVLKLRVHDIDLGKVTTVLLVKSPDA